MSYSKSERMQVEDTVIPRPTRGLGGVITACWAKLLMGKVGLRERRRLWTPHQRLKYIFGQ
jgi:hypothetical protein